ncbi:hypothetical protein [Pseudooceanicola sp. MF1-13]|uniref:hypothetical protein n=1 Tax=Pseudooceanicola sp. MF1-13 TaxID=3379095 RepID=UPI0038922F35
MKTREDSFSYVAFDRHRDWFGDTYRDVYIPNRRAPIPLPFREVSITAETQTRAITCADSYGDDAKIKPRIYNACEGKGPVYLSIRYKTLDGEWKTFAWRKIEGRKLATGLPLTWNSIIYTFARIKATEGGNIQGWGGSDAEFEIDDQPYGFKKHTLAEDYWIGFNC